MEHNDKKAFESKGVVFGRGIPKICVSVFGSDLDDVLYRAKDVSSLPIDLVEWRADYYMEKMLYHKIDKLFKGLREIFNDKPLLVTYRTKKEGGFGSFNEYRYVETMKCIIESEDIDLIDLEYWIGEKNFKRLIKAAHKEGIKVIASYHNFHATPDQDEILKILRDMQDYGADMTKIAVMPQNMHDVLTFWDANLKMKEGYADRPYITMAMGNTGSLTRLTGEAFGSAVTFAHAGEPSAPGQLHVKDVLTGLKVIHKAVRRHIFIIGFMGVGKTYITERLSEVLEMPEYDTDLGILMQERKNVNEIFDEYGEEYFRDLETRQLINLDKEASSVVSCGGGIVLRKENIEAMKRQGKVVWLIATPETVYERVKDSKSRPLLNGKCTVGYIKELMAKREKHYKEAADIVVDTDGKNTKEIIDEIIHKLYLVKFKEYRNIRVFETEE